ncbi:MAG TPA: hypothetical protein VK866_06535 [Acidimicrobiales bacterium]|nr:hypothetical protein [Acidimicrobiales bacterium]
MTGDQHPTPSPTALVRLVGLVALLVSAAGVLLAAGAALPAPPSHPSTALAWWRAHEPVLAVVSLVRVGALVVVAHLGATTTLGALAAVVRSRRLARWAQRLSPRSWAAVLRPLVVVAGVTVAPVASAGASPTVAVSVTADPDPTPFELRLSPSAAVAGWEMVLLGPSPATDPSGATAAATPGSDAGTTGPPSVDLAAPTVEISSPDAVPPEAGAADITRLAAPGDSLWSLSADRLAEVAGRPVTAGEVAPYWRDVIAANAATIPDPGLVFVGQAVRLPAPQLP